MEVKKSGLKKTYELLYLGNVYKTFNVQVTENKERATGSGCHVPFFIFLLSFLLVM